MANSLDKIAHKFRPYIAFTALNAMWSGLDKDVLSIVDVGCGKGEPMKFVNRSNSFYVVGLDIFKPALKNCKTLGIYADYVLCDVKALPLKQKSFDVSLCSEVLEHLEKVNGEQLIQSLEKTARKQVIIATPVGKFIQSTLDGNPYQEHKWIWRPAGLKQLGYKVRGVGIRNIGGEAGLSSRIPKIFKLLMYPIWVLTGPLTYCFPLISGHMICFKTNRSNAIRNSER